MSSYPVLFDKSIDQWKVSELKEELKRRSLTTKGLKDELVRRLDESLRNEIDINNPNADSGSSVDPLLDVQSQLAMKTPDFDEKTSVVMNGNDNKNTKLNDDAVHPKVDYGLWSSVKEQVLEGDSGTSPDSALLESERVIESTIEAAQATKVDSSIDVTIVESSSQLTTVNQVTTVDSSVEVTTVGSSFQYTTVDQVTTEDSGFKVTTLQSSSQFTTVDIGPVSGENLVTEIASGGETLQDIEILGTDKGLKVQPQHEDSNPPCAETKLRSSDHDNQVFEVTKIASDSICNDNVSINEKIELKDNIIADDVKFEFNGKPAMEEPLSNNIVLDDGNLLSIDVKEPKKNKVTVENSRNDADNPDSTEENDRDAGFSKKLVLDLNSGYDSMVEAALESKHIESISISDEVEEKKEKVEVPMVREDFPTDLMVDDDVSAEDNDVIKTAHAVASVKRKLNGQETSGNGEITKRQRKWNYDGLKIHEPQSDSVSPSITLGDKYQSTAKRNFSRSDSTATIETPKERVVPPPTKPLTSALRIDRFLRPFTLKAVQELLGKTGTVTYFWMDQIKTHCYVGYSSVEEAIETRNSIYNLQWPPNGGHLLVAEFVEPEEVKMRVVVPSSQAIHVSKAPLLPPPVFAQPQPSPRLLAQRQFPLPPRPPVPLPPPPPLSAPPATREPALPPLLSAPPATMEPALPPPPPVAEKAIPPVLSLNDLFRKTRATPRIFYLPLSDEQVAGRDYPT